MSSESYDLSDDEIGIILGEDSQKFMKTTRLKKYLASRAVSSKSGRNWVQEYLGPNGSVLVDAVSGAVDIHRESNPDYDFEGGNPEKVYFQAFGQNQSSDRLQNST
eukprot:1117007_1